MRDLLYFSIATCLLIFLTNDSFASGPDSKPLRVEIELDEARSAHYIIPLANKEVVVFFEKKESASQGKRDWSFSLYDSVFNKKWEKTTGLHKKFDVIDWAVDTNYIYLLGNTSKNNTELALVDLRTKKVTSTPLDLIPRSIIWAMAVKDGYLYFGGYQAISTGILWLKVCAAITIIPCLFGVQHYKPDPVLYVMKGKDKNAKFQRVSYRGSAWVDGMESPEDGDKVNVFLKDTKKGDSKLQVIQYVKGKKKNTLNIRRGNINNVLMDGSITNLNDDEILVAGTYGNVESKKGLIKISGRIGSFDLPTSYSRGIYISRFDGRRQQYISYYPFSDFKNYTKYLSNKAEERLEKKKQRKKSKGKQVDYDTRILPHEVIKRGDEFIMVMESYYPTYRAEQRMVGDQWKTDWVFDGWQWTHAIIAGFDKDGKLLWDNQFPIDMKSFSLRKRVRILPVENSDDLLMVYAHGNKLLSRVVSGTTVKDANVVTDIARLNKFDKVKDTYSSQVEHWYDNYFIAYGSQKLKSKQKGKRKVFFFNKISYK